MKTSNNPIRKKLFNEIEKLYHYTNFDSALKILGDGKLRFSLLGKMNDIYESHRLIFSDLNSQVKLEDIENEFIKYRQISLTQDSLNKIGFIISPMWGHYAEKGNGVCLVFDKGKISDSINTKMEHHQISYEKEYTGAVICDNKDINLWFENNIQEIFFKKSDEWSYEQEYRIITKCSQNEQEQYFSFGDALIAVIMCYDKDIDRNQSIFNSNQYNSIFDLTDVPIYEYGVFLNEKNLKDSNGKCIWPSSDLKNYKIDI